MAYEGRRERSVERLFANATCLPQVCQNNATITGQLFVRSSLYHPSGKKQNQSKTIQYNCHTDHKIFTGFFFLLLSFQGENTSSCLAKSVQSSCKNYILKDGCKNSLWFVWYLGSSKLGRVEFWKDWRLTPPNLQVRGLRWAWYCSIHQKLNRIDMDNPQCLQQMLQQMQAPCLFQLSCFLPGWTVESRNVHENNFRHRILDSQLWINQLCQLLSECFIVLLASRILPYLCGLKIQLLNSLTGEGRRREHKPTNINIESMLKAEEGEAGLSLHSSANTNCACTKKTRKADVHGIGDSRRPLSQ